MRILHVGCGRKKLSAPDLCRYVGLQMATDEAEVVHLDADPDLKPDALCALGYDDIPLPNDSVDLVIAWHVLEHIGVQGHTDSWFEAWQELYRVLKPGGWIYGESPTYRSIWAWSDPTHTRAISEHSFVFFCQDSYRIPDSAISPYRIRCDFKFKPLAGMPKGFAIIARPDDPRVESIRFALEAVKPLRPWWED